VVDEGVEAVTPEEIADRQDLRRQLVLTFERSITGAKSPAKAAEYVVNVLTVHRLDLLAAAAALFVDDDTRAGT
jgi:hypothetical protein